MTAGLSSPEPEAGGASNEDAPLLPPPLAVERRTPVRRYADASETVRGNSGPILKLAMVLDPVAYDPAVEAVTVGQLWDRQRRQAVATAHATAAHTAGYRLLVVGDDTIERLARSVSEQAIAAHDGPIDGLAWDEDTEESREQFRWVARAVVRALRNDTGPAATHHACCPHRTAKTGSCVRCGVRDAVAWELCGECDREVEAEAAGGSAALREGQ